MPFFMDEVANSIKMHAQKMDQTYGFARHVKILEYNPETNRVICGHYNPATEKYDILTNWMPWVTPSNGQGVDAASGKLWGQVFTPCIDEFAFMIPVQGDHDNGIVMGGIFTDKRPPPELDGQFTKAGEWLWFSHDGSYLKFVNGGNVFFKADDNLNVIVDGFANVTILGNTNVTIGGNVVLNVDGDVTATIGGQMTANVDGAMTANVGTTLTANVVGDVNVETAGQLIVQADGNISLLSRATMTLEANDGIILASHTKIVAESPITLEPATSGAVIPLLPIFTVAAPPKPIKAEDQGTYYLTGGAPVGNPAPPGPPGAVPGTPLAPQNPTISDITPTSADLNFDPPSGVAT